jgi:hypothetical protein
VPPLVDVDVVVVVSPTTADDVVASDVEVDSEDSEVVLESL